jgi:predicted exporter
MVMGDARRPPLNELDEDELVRRARAAMARAAALPPGSIGRAIQWAAYDTVMAELDRRAIALVASGSEPGAALRELRAMLAVSPRRKDVP